MHSGVLEYRHVDLHDSVAATRFLETALEYGERTCAASVCLINNAAVITPVGPAESLDPESIPAHLTVNLTVPMVLTTKLLAWVTKWNSSRSAPEEPVVATIVNISSRAAQSPYFGRSPYCAGKAALDMFTRVVALEQQERNLPHRIYAVRPGVIDTYMQTYSRNLPDEATRDKELFERLKRDRLLAEPEQAAEQVLRTLRDERVRSGHVVDVRDLYPD